MLTDKKIRNLENRDRPYKETDSGGMYLLVNPNGSRLWRFDYQLDGKRGTVALGVYQRAGGERGGMSLAEARAERDRCRDLLRRGIRPADLKAVEAAKIREEAQAAREKARADRLARTEAARAKREQRQAEFWTVERVCEAWATDHSVALAPVTVRSIRQSFRDHVYPTLGAKPIVSVTTSDVIDVIQAMLDAGLVETAGKVRRRLAAVWQFAVLKHHATADVVAPTSREISKRVKAARVLNPPEHHACVPLAEAPALMTAIRNFGGSPVTRAALLLLAYTMVRTGELRQATWDQFDLEGDAPTWVVPAAAMKVKRRGERAADDHIVPLSSQAVAVLKDLKGYALDPQYVLPNARKAGKPISENAALYALWDLGYRGRMTGHGFRALGSTMLNEAGFDSALIEAQLAHEKRDKVEAAYNRATHLERRRLMMQRLADMLDAKPTANVVPMVRAG